MTEPGILPVSPNDVKLQHDRIVELVKRVTTDGLQLEACGLKLAAYSLVRRRRRELVTTLTEDKPIATSAMMGWSRPSMASGIATTL